MPALVDFTSYDEIRAVLGVSNKEIEDETLGLPLYVLNLQFDLSDVSATLESTYLALVAQPSRTDAEQRVVNVTSVFSAYATAKTLLAGAPLFAPKTITDGKAEHERITDPFETLRQDVQVGFLSLKTRLKSALEAVGVVVSSTTSRTYFSSAGLATDPVTNI
jgi:hypothetical protein